MSGAGRSGNACVMRARGLHRKFGALTAVNNLDLELNRSEIFGLVGPDGAGKTTVMRLLCGILDPSAGEATVAGFDVFRRPEEVKRRIGYMPQRFSLYGDLTVAENICFYAGIYHVSRVERLRREKELLEFSRLGPFRHRLAQDLSGGMKQKLALICTLIHTPEVLFLDEPTTGVDPLSRRDFWKILYALPGEGVAVFVSTPYMDEAERCDRVALMDQGRVLQSGTPASLKEGMHGDMLEVTAQPQRHAGEVMSALPQVRSVQIFGDRLHVGVDDAGQVQEQLPAVLEKNGIRLAGVRRISPGLEDVFVSMVTAPGVDGTRGGSLTTNNQLVLRSSTAAEGRQPATGLGERTAVTVKDLVKTFGNFKAVDRISFTVPRGEIFGFLGPNGAGKSTTIRMLCGIIEPTSGQGSVAGFDIFRQPEQIKQHIGYMSQKFSLYNDLTVEENIEFYADIYGVSLQRLAERRSWILEMAGLKERRHSLTGELSAGWKQRLALGCAMVHEPEILFLDEPTAGVDPLSRRAFWDLIYDTAERGVTVFVTTHYMDEAEHCNRIGLIYGGRLISLGSPAEIKRRAEERGNVPDTLEEAFIRLIERADATKTE